MRWPGWLSQSPSSAAPKNDGDLDHKPAPPATNLDIPSVAWTNSRNDTDWSYYTSPRTILPSVLLTATTLLLLRLYKLHLRRIPSTPYIPPTFFRRRSLYGYVTSVGDGDNFRLFHTPGGLFAGWGWAPGRRVAARTPKQVQGQTIHVRLAGVDAPECAHFGREAQPGSAEALAWLRGALVGRYVRAHVWRRDQYERVVATVYVRTWWGGRRDVGLEMLRLGHATVYEAKFGSEFGSSEEAYRRTEEVAKRAGVGIWRALRTQPGVLDKLLGRHQEKMETPRQYKERVAAGEKKQGKTQKS